MSQGPGRILIADDEVNLRDILRIQLERHGFVVLAAENGQQAVEIALKEQPDVIILDVMMPLVDGFAVLGRLKAHPDLRTIPVIMLTARGQERDVLSGLQAGAADYIVKPFSLKELIARVDVALRVR